MMMMFEIQDEIISDSVNLRERNELVINRVVELNSIGFQNHSNLFHANT